MKKQLLKILLSGLVFCGIFTIATIAQAKKALQLVGNGRPTNVLYQTKCQGGYLEL